MKRPKRRPGTKRLPPESPEERALSLHIRHLRAFVAVAAAAHERGELLYLRSVNLVASFAPKGQIADRIGFDASPTVDTIDTEDRRK